jgi:hypothetical protein
MEALLGFTFNRPNGLVERGKRVASQYLATDAFRNHPGEIWA